MAKAKSAGSGAEKIKATVVDTPTKKNTVKSVYKGTLSFGLISIPVKAFKAAEADSIERHMYHSATCLNRIRENTKVVCSGCNAEVDSKLTVKGVEYDGKIVIVSDDDMASCYATPEAAPKINITEFVPSNGIDPIYYSSTEFLAPNDGGAEAFAYFRQILAEMDVVAIGSIQWRGHEYEVVIRPTLIHADGLAVSYLFAEYEIRNCDKWQHVDTQSEMVEMFKTLVEGMMKPKFTPAEYDGTLRRQRDMIKTLAGGGKVAPVVVTGTPAASGDLMSQMKVMLEQQKAKKAAAGSKK
jgi:DNA end-binding protein Ku